MTINADRLSQRHTVGRKAQVASASSAAAAALRAVLANPGILVGPLLRSETALVLAWLDILATCSNQGELGRLVNDSEVIRERYLPASLMVRALAVQEPTPRIRADVTAAGALSTSDEIEAALEAKLERALEKILGSREGIEFEGDTLRVVDPRKAGTLAQQLEQISSALVDDAYEMDRERSGQFAVA